MLFSEKMTKIPQPQRRALWDSYRILCTALTLNATLQKEKRSPSEEELSPLRASAQTANGILAEFQFTPSFFPEQEDFFPRLLEELSAISKHPSGKD